MSGGCGHHCAPHRPDKHPFVERYHRAFEYACIRIYRPHDLHAAMTMTVAFQRFYNEERPHQGLSCANQPPRMTFPTLPTLPRVPALVDADRWLQAYDGHIFRRNVQPGGRVRVADLSYYVKMPLLGQQIALRVDAEAGQFVVEAGGQEVQRLQIKGLGYGTLPFPTFVQRLCADLRAVKRFPPLRPSQRL